MKRTSLYFLLALLVLSCCLFAACGKKTPEDNKISGLSDFTATCGDTVPGLHATAAFGDVTYGLAKAVDGTAKENLTYGAYSGTLTYGTWYVQASVPATEDYQGAEQYATITVSHRTFDAITGDGTYRSEETEDGRIHSWYEKTCACGTVVRGNEQISDKHGNAITGLSDRQVSCGDILDLSGVGATHGTPTLAFAAAEDGKEMTDLTWGAVPATGLSAGVYYIRVTVAASETDNYMGAEQYATVTVTHIAFDRLTGEEKIQDPSGTEKGYNYKECVCGDRVRGEREFVTATIRVDGETVSEQIVEVGSCATAPALTAYRRENYTPMLVDGNGAPFSFAEATVTDFVTYDLSVAYIYVFPLSQVALYERGGAHWMFVVGSDACITAETVSTFTWNEEDGVAVITSRYYKDKKDATPQFVLESGRLSVYDTYTFAFRADSALDLWFGDNYEGEEGVPTSGAFHYTQAMAAAGTQVTVTVTRESDGNVRVRFGDTERVYAWDGDNFESSTFRIGNKRYVENTEENSAPYTLTVTGVTHTYDYASEARAILAALPAGADGVTEANVHTLEAQLALFEEVSAHFTAAEEARFVFPADIKDAIAAILGNKYFIANEFLKDLPTFSYAEAAGKSAEEKGTYYENLLAFLLYTENFTPEEMATLEARYTGIGRKVALYRYYFANGGIDYVMDKVISGDSTLVTAPGFTVSGTTLKKTDAQLNTVYLITLPAIHLDYYKSGSVYMYLRIAPGGDGIALVTDPAGTAGFGATTTNASNWVELRFTKNAETGKWQAELHVPDPKDPVVYVDLDDSVVRGETGYTIAVKLTSGTTSTLEMSLVDGKVNNRIFGQMTPGDTTVCEVTYTYYDGSLKTTKEYYLAGDRITSLPTAQASYENKAGYYTLTGWQCGDTTIAPGGTVDITVNGHLTITAVYREVKKQYKVTYYDDTTPYTEEELPGQRTYYYDDEIVLPATAPDGGTLFLFVGWYTSPTFESGTQYTGGEKITGNLDLYARFVEKTPAKVTLTNLTTADIVDETNYYVGSKYAKPADPVREGYTFGGWYNAADDTPYDFSADLAGDLTLYARWLVADDTRLVLITADGVKSSLTLNWGVVNTKDYGKGWLYSSFGENELYRFKEGVKIGGDGRTQLWTLPKINFNLYSKLEFAMSNEGKVGTLTFFGETFTAPDGGEQKHLLFSFSDGKLHIYGINSYTTPLATLTVPEAILNGSEAMTIQLACTSGELLITEFIAENKYYDYVAGAVDTDAAFAAWCNSNIGNPSAMTDEQKAEFAKQLNTLSIARASMTDYEQKKFPVSGIITYIYGELTKADDAWFNLFGVDDIAFGKLYRDAKNDKTDQSVMNAAYGAKNQTDKVNYYAFVTDGAQTDPGVFTLPKINFRALGLTLSFNVCAQGTSTSISFDGGTTSSKLSSNLQYCFVVSVYKDAADGKWYMQLHGDNTYKLELTERQVDGQDALSFTVIPDTAAWYQFYISDISATF